MKSSYLNVGELDAESKKLLISSEVEQQGKKLELGWLGIIFGAKENCAPNIAGFVAVFCVIVGSAITVILLYKNSSDAFVCWEKFSAIVTLVLGYLFGIKSGCRK